MSTLDRIAKNTGVIFVGEIFIKLLDFITVIYLARYLGISLFGVYSFVFAYITLFTFLLTVGINKVLVREIARDSDEAERIIGNAMTIRILLSIFAIVLASIIINLLGYPQETKILVYVASFTLLLSSIRLTFQTLFDAHLMMKYSELASIAGKIVSVILILTIISLNGSLMHITIAIVISGFFDLFTIYIFFKKFIKLRFKFDLSYSKKILKTSFPLTLALVITMLYSKFDVMLLSLMKTNADVGYYSAAYKLTDGLSIIPLSLMSSLYPLMSRYHKTSRELLIATYERGFRLLSIIGLPIAIGTTVYSQRIIYFIYGSEFLPSASILSLMVWCEVFLFINLLDNNVIISMERQTAMAYIAVSMGITDIILNYLLIPEYGYMGAAVATLFVAILGNVIRFYYVYTNLIKKTFSTIYLRLVLIGVLFYIFLLAVSFMPLYLIIPLSLIFYFLLLVTSKLVVEEEVVFLRGFIQSTNNLLISRIYTKK